MDPVALWLLTQAVGPDVYTRLADRLRDRSYVRRLAAEVRQKTGVRPGRRYRRWLRDERTWRLLVSRHSDAYEELVASLATAEAQRMVARHAVEDRAQAIQLVNATIAHFLPALDPSLATAVADFRAERRHEEVLARFDASESFEDRLALIPVGARRFLEVENVHRGSAERLVDAIARGNPRAVVSGFVADPPPWLVNPPAVIVRALAELALAFDLRAEGALLLERSADLGLDRVQACARAAFEYAALDRPDERDRLIAKARLGGSDPYVDVIEAACQEDWDGVVAAIDEATAEADPLTAQIYALALHQRGDRDRGIAVLERVVAANREYTGVALRLVQLLLERGMSSGTSSRLRDLTSAFELAVGARDLRRVVRLNSGEAVELACRAAFAVDDYRQVIRVGAPRPEGEAWSEEAAVPEVQFHVAAAALAMRDHEMARRVASAASGFHQALIMADVMAATDAPPADVEAQFGRAWDLVEDEEQKVTFWLSASQAGIEPLPGQAELARRTDDLPLLVTASQHLACGRVREAIDLLRPARNSEAARRLLAMAYLQADRIDDAVAELLDTASRFDNVEHLTRAVKVLVRAGRVDDAAPHAERGLAVVPPGRPDRNLLHEVGVAAAHNRGDWPDMEVRARAWIDESGPDRRRQWLLVQALYNQADPEAAWRVWREHRFDPERPMEAQLWIDLNARFAPSLEMLSTALGLCDRFAEDTDLRATAVNAFLMGDGKGEIPADELARWQSLIAARAENPAPGDFFVKLSVPDDPDLDQLTELFRPMLEPQAQRVEEWLSKVRTEGWPYGMLAAAAGRSYAWTLVHRAAGFLPIAVADEEYLNVEIQVANASLDRPVVVDLSVVAVCYYLRDRWAQLLGAFSRVEMTSDAKRDAALAADTMRPRSTKTLGWDVRTGRPIAQEIEPAVLDRLEAHLAWVNATAASLTTSAYKDPDDDQESDHFSAWTTTLEAARASGLPLWTDDVGLRTVACNEGMVTFGTLALLHAFEARGRLSPDDLKASMTCLREEYCVDLPLDPEWSIESARATNWAPGPALTVFTRPATWRNLPQGLSLWREIATEAGNEPAKVAPWVYAAVVGTAGAADTSAAGRLAAGILAHGAAAVGFDPAGFAACVSAASAAAAEAGLSDATEAALQMIFELTSQRIGTASAASLLARLVSELTEDQRAAARRVLFGTRSSDV